MGPPLMRGPRISQYVTGDRDPANPDGGDRQLRFNRAVLRLYGGGTIPFMGDYIDVAPVPFLPDGNGGWRFNGLVNNAPPTDAALGTFQTAWTDNRDATIGLATTDPVTQQLNYTPPFVLPLGATIADFPCPVEDGKSVDNTQTRDANVYTSRITQDFSLTAPGNAKPTNTPGVVRTFAIQLANNRELTPPPPTGPEPPETPTRFKLELSSASASFSRNSFTSSLTGGTCGERSPPVQTIFVNVLPRSSIARTVYVRCGTAAAASVVVTATEMISNVPGATASVVLNPDPSNRPTRGPDGSVLGAETHTPDAENPDAENPDAENPDAENPDAENPDAENPDAENPDAENPDAENPDAENPDAENPDAENPDAENANFQDVSVDITNNGVTTSGFQAQVQTTSNTTGYSFLLMGRRVYSTPTSINCNLVRDRRNQTLFGIPLEGADLAPQPFFDENTEDVKHPTFLVRPGESIRVTLRIVRNAATTPEPFCSADPTSPDYCFNKLEFRTQAQAPNTGQTVPDQDVLGEVRTAFLSFDSQPTDGYTNAAIGGSEGPIRVRAEDGEGDPISGIQVTMGLGENPGDTSLGGTVTRVTDVDGFATFDDLTIDESDTGYTLVASAENSDSVESDPFDITDALVVVNTSNSWGWFAPRGHYECQRESGARHHCVQHPRRRSAFDLSLGHSAPCHHGAGCDRWPLSGWILDEQSTHHRESGSRVAWRERAWCSAAATASCEDWISPTSRPACSSPRLETPSSRTSSAQTRQAAPRLGTRRASCLAAARRRT